MTAVFDLPNSHLARWMRVQLARPPTDYRVKRSWAHLLAGSARVAALIRIHEFIFEPYETKTPGDRRAAEQWTAFIKRTRALPSEGLRAVITEALAVHTSRCLDDEEDLRAVIDALVAALG